MRSFIITCVLAAAVIGWSTHCSSPALGGGITTSPLPKGPYAEYTVIDAGLYLCNGQPCFKADGGFDDAVDLVSNQTVLGVKTWGTRNDFPAGIDAGFIIGTLVGLVSPDGGRATVMLRTSNNALQFIGANGQAWSINNVGNLSGPTGNNITVARTDGGTAYADSSNPGVTLGASTGVSHAARTVIGPQVGGGFGYCSDHGVWYMAVAPSPPDGGGAQVATDLTFDLTGNRVTVDAGAMTANSFCPADGGSCWTGQSSRGVGTLSGYYDNQLLGNGKPFVQTRTPIAITGKSLTWMPTKTGVDALNNFTVDVYDLTTTTVLCVTGNLACNNTAGTAVVVSCSSSAAAGDDIQVRINEGSCGGPIFGTGAWTYQ